MLLPDQLPHAARWQTAQGARNAQAMPLAEALQASRKRTLALADAYEAALGPLLAVPLSPQFNPPLWELGHIAWFQDHWLTRNPQRERGILADPCVPRLPSRTLASTLGADALYDSSHVPHDARWALPLPDLNATRGYAQAVLDDALALLGTLSNAPQEDAALYFHRLVLFHEDMHAEAATYMAQALGIPLNEALCARPQARTPAARLTLAAQSWSLGWPGDGFAFDNELGRHNVALSAFDIDSQCVRWGQYLPFVEEGGYNDARWWTAPGWQWQTDRAGIGHPRYLRRANTGRGWEGQRFGNWQPLDMAAPAVHLTHFEAEAWCRWAGRALPTEAQWECAAMTQTSFDWGEVWEWTASPFAAYPGFVAHPYLDYSAPWFGSRPVLRGASVATSPRLAHPRYRNYFTPERNDVHAGFRSCSAPAS